MLGKVRLAVQTIRRDRTHVVKELFLYLKQLILLITMYQ